VKNKSYHKFVFDENKRKYIGNFDDMYQFEKTDPWQCSDLSNSVKKIHSAILNTYNFNTILDYGCGKGVFTHTLKKENNKVYGVDISENAIQKAKLAYADKVNFSTVSEKHWNKRSYDLVVCLEVLSYVKEYKKLLQNFAIKGKFLYLSLYIPKKPIGFVKNVDGLINYLKMFYSIKIKVIYNDQSIFIFAKSKKYKSIRK